MIRMGDVLNGGRVERIAECESIPIFTLSSLEFDRCCDGIGLTIALVDHRYAEPLGFALIYDKIEFPISEDRLFKDG